KGLKGKIHWQAHTSPTDKIDLEKVFSHGDAGVAYALCWVNVDARRVVLSTGSDDGIKVWVNRREVLARNVRRDAEPGDDKAAVELASGWNELLVKVDNRFGSWAFYLELLDPVTNKPLPGVGVRLSPPGEGDRKFVRDWLLLGPFPNPDESGHDKAYPPES